MTLEEWRAKNAPAETVPKLEPRKIAEGSSEFFKDAKQLLKTEDNDYFAGKVRHACQRCLLYSTNHFQQPKTTSAPRPRKETKQFIEIDAHFDPPSRGGRGRGGRNARPKKKTVEELDAEMADYFPNNDGGADAMATNGAGGAQATAGGDTNMDADEML